MINKLLLPVIFLLPAASGYAAPDATAPPMEDGATPVYLVLPDGPGRHLFADEEWLGVVTGGSYLQADLPAGEHLIWTDDGDLGLVFLNTAKTHFLQVLDGDVVSLPEDEGKRLLGTASPAPAGTAADRRDADHKSKKYPKMLRRAHKKGLYAQCRFTDARRAELERRGAAGDVEAQLELGHMLWDGKCLWKDPAASLSWFRTAAENGSDEAAIFVGRIMCTYTPEQPVEAVHWYGMAAQRGSLEAQRQLGWMYGAGQCVEQDLHEAVKWYKMAWEQHHDQRSRLQAESLDPERVAAARREAEANAREAAERQRRLQQRKRQQREKRLSEIRRRYGRIGVAVAAMENEPTFEQPARKKPDRGRGGAQSGLDYLVPAPPGIMLGLLAAGVVFEALESVRRRQLSGADKQEIALAADHLHGAMDGDQIQTGLRRTILESAQLPPGEDLYHPVDYQPEEIGGNRYSEAAMGGASTVIEVETLGAGLVLVEKRYRPARFMMANRIRVVRARDGEALDEQFLCYTSPDAPRFSEWAAADAERLRTELSNANAYVATSVQRLLTASLYSSSAEQKARCAALDAGVTQVAASHFDSPGRR